MYRRKLNVIKGEEKDIKKIMNKFKKMRFKKVSKYENEEAKLTLLIKEDFEGGKLISIVAVVREIDGKITAYRYKTNYKPHDVIERRFEERIPFILSKGKPVRRNA